MGTRYIISVKCPECGVVADDCYYAPTCDFVTHECVCGHVIDLAEYTGIMYEEASNAAEIGRLLEVQKSSWWPTNPYPKSIFPMPREQYAEIVPDSKLRTGLSGMLGREYWDIASDAIWVAMCEADEWTETWPVEPGYYWFYGWCSAPLRRDYESEMVLVKVSKAVNAIAYVTNGRFVYKDAVGLWKKAVLPEPPDLEGLCQA